MKLAARALIIVDNEILLVRHHHRDFYALPGGKIDGQESIQHALSREMFEELGVEVKNPKLVFLHEFRYPGSEDISVEFFFLAGNSEDFKNWKEGSHTTLELAEIVWKPIDSKFELKPLWLKEKLSLLSEKSEVEYISLEQ